MGTLGRLASSHSYIQEGAHGYRAPCLTESSCRMSDVSSQYILAGTCHCLVSIPTPQFHPRWMNERGSWDVPIVSKGQGPGPIRGWSNARLAQFIIKAPSYSGTGPIRGEVYGVQEQSHTFKFQIHISRFIFGFRRTRNDNNSNTI